MKRKIQWNINCYDEIELVYEKGKSNEDIAKLLSELEEIALTEAAQNCGLLSTDKGPVTPEEFQMMDSNNKEAVMYYLGQAGLSYFNADISNGEIVVRFSPFISLVMGCTMFSIINRLEKLDGSFNAFCSKSILKFQTPLGGEKGIVNWEMLILQLYPWLTINETSTDEIAVPVQQTVPQNMLKEENYCACCGGVVKEREEFCQHCGTKIDSQMLESQDTNGVEEKSIEEKELEKYLSPSEFPIIIGAVLFVFGSVGAIVAGVGGATVVLGIIALLIMSKTVITKMDVGDLLKSLRKQGILSTVIMDFKHASPCMDNAIKLGSTYLFGENTGTLVKYEEISKIYQWIHKTNFVEDKRELRIVLQSGNTRCLCNLPLKGEADHEVAKICVAVKMKNPSVQIGSQ